MNLLQKYGNRIEAYQKARKHKKRERAVLDRCGCIVICPHCDDILNDQADCTDTDLVRYKCNTCGKKSEWNFDAFPFPVVAGPKEVAQI